MSEEMVTISVTLFNKMTEKLLEMPAKNVYDLLKEIEGAIKIARDSKVTDINKEQPVICDAAT